MSDVDLSSHHHTGLLAEGRAVFSRLRRPRSGSLSATVVAFHRGNERCNCDALCAFWDPRTGCGERSGATS